MTTSTRRRTTISTWSTTLLLLCCVCAAALAVSACTGSDNDTAEEPSAGAAATTSDSSTASVPAEAQATSPGSAEEVARGFLEAYGAFDVDQAISYLADDADLSGLVSSVGNRLSDATLDDFRLFVSLLEAVGYKQILHPCEQAGSSTYFTNLRCPFDFHYLRSDEIGLGPFPGSALSLTVDDGEIVYVSNTFDLSEFSPQLYEPFAAWVSETYSEDIAVMYVNGRADFGAALTEQSIQLWEQHCHEYAEEVGTADG